MEAQALPSAPLKLTFRLGGAASATSTSTSPSASLAGGNASASPPASEADYAMSEAGSIAGAAPTPVTPAVATAATTAAPVAPAGATKKRKPAAPVFGEDGIEIPKPKRKRAPRRPVGEAGPGKSWRKGMKGNLAGLAGSIVGTQSSPTSSPAPRSSLPPPAASRAFPIGAPPRIATAFLPPMVLESKTPRPRAWTKNVKELTSITGMPLRFKMWIGRPDVVIPRPAAPIPAQSEMLVVPKSEALAEGGIPGASTSLQPPAPSPALQFAPPRAAVAPPTTPVPSSSFSSFAPPRSSPSVAPIPTAFVPPPAGLATTAAAPSRDMYAAVEAARLAAKAYPQAQAGGNAMEN